MDHKNLVFDNFIAELVLHWRLILEEYGPIIKKIKGPSNDAAGVLSRLQLVNYEVA